MNGLDCYASNEWFMERLGCSEQTVSNGMKELEERGEIVCERTRRSRLIKRKMRDPSQLGSQLEPTWVSDPNQLGTISNSNAINRIPLEISPENEGEKRATYAEQMGYATNRVKPIRLRGEEITGRKFPSPLSQEKSIARCLQAGYTEAEILACFESLLRDEFWGARGVDFATVSSQIGKAKKQPEKTMSFGKKRV